MKLRYETGIATLIQFVTLTLLNVGTGLVSIVIGCRTGIGNCVVNSFSSIVFFILIALWFGFVWILGFAAQERRSKRLAQALIAAEALIFLVALFNARHHIDALGLLTSIVDCVLAIWVMYLSFNLIKAGPHRIVKKSSERRHVKNVSVNFKK